ncbi:MAG TPA: glycosyltransferase family 39 protein, partial [Candidatus Dormibacteraeota bacterium]|nr:glycosyltransferase family 39 protein [Candidatus Dormibacteraeota bacterium]
GIAVVSMVGLAAVLLAPGLGRAPLDDPGEGQHAEIAREMLGGSRITPRLNGVRYFDKPPLLYWLTAASFHQWGLTEGAARLAPLLGALLAVAGTTLLGVRLLGVGGGLLAGAALLSCALFAAFARYLRPETLFVAALQWGFTGLLWRFVRAGAVETRPSLSGFAVVGCAALGVAALAKDLLGLVGPLAAVAIALWLAGRLRPIRAWLPALGIVLMVGLGVGWYVAVSATEPGFLWYTVVDNHVLNVARMRAFPDEDVPLSALEFLAAAGFGAFPWIVAAAVTVLALVRGRAWRDPAEVPWIALAIWAVGVLAVFTLSPFKLPHYGLPAYPAVALLAARAWRDAGPRPRGLIVAHLVLFLLLGAGLAWWGSGDGRAFTTAVFGITDVYSRKEAAWGQPSPYPPWSAIQPLLIRGSILLLAGAVALALAAARRSARAAAAVVGAVMLLLVPVVGDGLAATSSARAVIGMAREIRARFTPGDVLVLEGPIENAGAVEFYSGQRPALLDARRSVLGVGATFADSAATFWTTARFAEAWDSARPPYLLTTRVPAQSIAAQLPPESVRLLSVQNGRWLYGHARVAR